MPDPTGRPGLVLDTSVCINLLATRAANDVLNGLAVPCIIPDQVLAEVTRDPVTRTVLSDVDHPLRQLAPALGVVPLSGEERSLFLDLVGSPMPDGLGDGEAAAISVATTRGFDVALDDRKARRIIRERFPGLRMFWTVELLRAGSVVRALGSRRVDLCVEDAKRFGRMHVPPA